MGGVSGVAVEKDESSNRICFMNARRIYRWKSFWLGVVVLVFLGWAWVRSMNHVDTMKLGIGSKYWTVYLSGGRMGIERTSLKSFSGRMLHHFEFSSEERVEFDRRWFPPEIVRADPLAEIARMVGRELSVEEREVEVKILRNAGLDSMTWIFAWWFVVLLYAVPWALFLGWRWRRQRDLTEVTVED
ncbi:hypothetical protein [Luteolibacter soli]|uniref:DUF3592 domain-containing protein n=1 Tax=Luteolibacter soli TaxID=3135280 RepID=A0ABU9AVX9_9BACT